MQSRQEFKASPLNITAEGGKLIVQMRLLFKSLGTWSTLQWGHSLSLKVEGIHREMRGMVSSSSPGSHYMTGQELQNPGSFPLLGMSWQNPLWVLCGTSEMQLGSCHSGGLPSPEGSICMNVDALTKLWSLAGYRNLEAPFIPEINNIKLALPLLHFLY